MHVAPLGFLLLLPVAKRLQAEVEHPLRLAFLLRYEAHYVLVQSFLYYLSMYVGSKAELVLLFGHLTDKLILLLHVFFVSWLQRYE